MKETKVIPFRVESYENGQNPVVNVIEINDFGENVLSFWFNGEISYNNIMIDIEDQDKYIDGAHSNAAMRQALSIWNKVIRDNFINKGNQMEYKITRASYATIRTMKAKIKTVRVLDEVVRMKYDNRTVILTMLGHLNNNKEIFSSTIMGDTRYYKTDEFIFGEPVEVDCENGKVLYETPIIGVKVPKPTPTVHHTLLKHGNISQVLAHNECKMIDIIDFASGSSKLHFITLEKNGDKQTQVYKTPKEGTRAIATVALLNKFMTEAKHVNELMTMNLDEWNTDEPVVSRRHGKSISNELEDTETELGRTRKKAHARAVKLELCRKSNYRLEVENARCMTLIRKLKSNIDEMDMSWK